jgi:predicted nucleic-acid-binding protein
VRAVDTNVLVRLLTRDDAKQVQAAERWVAKGAWVSHLVVLETTWVLTAVYDRSREEIAAAIDMLLGHRDLVLQDPDTVAAALDDYRRRSKVEFSDCLIVAAARRAGHVPVGTFDRGLAKVEGVERL